MSSPTISDRGATTPRCGSATSSRPTATACVSTGRHDVLRGLARETALDVARFETDYAGEAYEALLRDCAEGAAWFGVSGLPTVILNEKQSLVGAVPVERYRLLIDWILAGEPGGVLPLAAATASTSAGQRPLGARETG